MTVIAWDGETLAADKKATVLGHGTTVTKIYRVAGGLAGLSGDGNAARALLDWVKAGRDVTKYPEEAKDDSAGLLLITNKGEILTYGKSPYPVVIEDKFTATGAGRDYALAAMHLGRNAKEAVEVACALDCFCGNGIDTLELKLDEERTTP